MRLLIITQKVDIDDSVLGFFHRWIVEFASHFESLVVICLGEGRHELPANVRVISLGKEQGNSKISSMNKFYRVISAERGNYDAVFVHMNPIYVVLGGLLWKLWHKPVTMWYTHRQVDQKLRVAYALSDTIFTASKQSFNMHGPKVMVTGHGIDVAQYSSIVRTKPLGEAPVKIIHVGRVTPIKDPMTLVEAAKLLRESMSSEFYVVFVGGPATEGDKHYQILVSREIAKHSLENIVKFTGNVSPDVMRKQYENADIAVNLTPTGGADKSVLEAMSAGVPVFSANESFRPYFGEYADRLMFKHGDSADLAGKIKLLVESGDYAVIGAYLQKVAVERADVRVLIGEISTKITDIKQTP